MSEWLFSFKPTFLHELQGFEPKESAQVLKKIDLLAQDPTPDAKTKKQLRHLGGKLHRVEGYFDRLTILGQLGLTPAPAAPPVCGIRAGRALRALGHTSCKRQASDSNPLTGSQLSGGLGAPAVEVRSLQFTNCAGRSRLGWRYRRDSG